MKKVLIIFCVTFCSLLHTCTCGFYEYLTGRNVDKEIELSQCIAMQEKERLRLTAEEAPEGTLFLPTNDAWNSSPQNRQFFRALMDPANGDLRDDLVLEVGTAAPGNWEELLRWTSFDGMLEAASSSLYYLHGDSRELCYAMWNDSVGDFEETASCAGINADGAIKLPSSTDPGVMQHIYKIDQILLSPELEEELLSVSSSLSDRPIKSCADL